MNAEQLNPAKLRRLRNLDDRALIDYVKTISIPQSIECAELLTVMVERIECEAQLRPYDVE